MDKKSERRKRNPDGKTDVKRFLRDNNTNLDVVQ